jgi:HYR domain
VTKETRTKTRIRWAAAMVAMVGVVTTVAGSALADNLDNDAGTTSGVTTITAGASTTITYTLKANSGQGDPNGCNATVANPVTVTINRPSGVTGPSSLSFTGCGTGSGGNASNDRTASFSAASPGSYSITHSISGGVSGSEFDNKADFTLTVNAATPSNTAPKLNLPSDITAEATSASGAAVSFTASASDTEDGGLTPTCVPASGSVFPLGSPTQVNCSATDSGNLTTSGHFNVTVEDTKAPSLIVPNDITAEATGAAGAIVTYDASAEDLVDGSVDVSCVPASGSSFAFGTTAVACSATDAHGNNVTGNFNVTVQDTTPPSISGMPTDQTEEATGPSGALVSWPAPTASDEVDGSVPVSCSPAAGSTFALGTATVTCSATDAHHNTANKEFKVSVQDTTPPTLTLPKDMTKEATGPTGATASWQASASDLVDGTVPVTCDATSGDTFPLGTTTVTCSSTDAHDNTKSNSFTVTVEDTTAPSMSLPANIKTTADANSTKVVPYTASASDLVDGDVSVACTPASGSAFHVGTTTVNCSATDAHGNEATGSFTVTVVYDWKGFFQPVDNLPALNSVKAGSAVPVKFSLGGNHGLNIFEAGFPKSSIVPSSDSPADVIEQTVTAGNSSLNYDATADQYVYVWKTDKAWAGTSRQLQVKLADETIHTANFKVLK